MRILIDLQGAQSESRFRGIGRYSLALALGVARNAGDHEVWLLLNGALSASINELRAAFEGLVPRERIRVFDIVSPTAEIDAGNGGRRRAAEMLREQFIAQLHPDMVLVTSLFEGYIDNAIVAVGRWGARTPTAVILYDLIPFLQPDAYLGTPEQREYYGRKIVSLRNADLLLAISDYSRQEAVDALALDPARVQAISTAVDDSFYPAPVDLALQAGLLDRLGIDREFLMYAPGGFDSRKNIDGLISAFGLLPAATRETHQLVIASKLGEHERRVMNDHARQSGLAPGQLILTGYVSDADLITLYRTTKLFVFPSKHEGFGLPALEAMACGAIVIGADTTSVPEVIGCAEALFDPMSTNAIAAKIATVLGDSAMQTRLREHGRQQAQKFSWDITAQRAILAMERHVSAASAAAAVHTPAATEAVDRPRLAFVSPLPPERSGIADYAVALLPALMTHFDIDLIAQQESTILPHSLSTLPLRTPQWLAEHSGSYALIVYQMGNSPAHAFMFPLLQAHPGVVVLHDFFLADVLAYQQASGAVPGAWLEALYYSHGFTALATLQRKGIEATRQTFPCNRAVLEAATAVIVHSNHAVELAKQWYGPNAAANWSVVPLPRAAAVTTSRAVARAALGIDENTFLVCSFGYIAPTKLIKEILDAWSASGLHQDAHCLLVLVGANHSGDYGIAISKQIAALGASARISGFADAATYRHYLEAADLAIQLRGTSRGETSAAVLDCMNYGIPTIVNDSGALGELPDHAVVKLASRFTITDLGNALNALRRDPAGRRRIGMAGADVVIAEHNCAHCASLYGRAFEHAINGAVHDRHALISALAQDDTIAADDRTLQQLSFCIAALPHPLTPRQLLFDVSTISQHDLQTGIERVVRTQLMELLRLPPGPLHIEPVYFSNRGGRPHYRYASAYTRKLLGLPSDGLADAVIDTGPGDLFYSADYAPAAASEAASCGIYADWRARGVDITFLVYDLLPVLRPEFFPPNANLRHEAWLEAITDSADNLLCISNAVKDDLENWIGQRKPSSKTRIAVLPLGANLSPHRQTRAPSAIGGEGATSFLMVGTLEPRKGHLQALAAFELLWSSGSMAQLIIAGNEGWQSLHRAERRTIPALVEKIRNHPELGKKLLWVQGASDAQLEQLYQSSSCLLAASEAEGLGLPLIEAAYHGLPIVTRDLPVFHEVIGEHALYFSGVSAEALAGCLQQWLALFAADNHPKVDGIVWHDWAASTRKLLRILSEQ